MPLYEQTKQQMIPQDHRFQTLPWAAFSKMRSTLAKRARLRRPEISRSKPRKRRLFWPWVLNMLGCMKESLRQSEIEKIHLSQWVRQGPGTKKFRGAVGAIHTFLGHLLEHFGSFGIGPLQVIFGLQSRLVVGQFLATGSCHQFGDFLEGTDGKDVQMYCNYIDHVKTCKKHKNHNWWQDGTGLLEAAMACSPNRLLPRFQFMASAIKHRSLKSILYNFVGFNLLSCIDLCSTAAKTDNNRPFARNLWYAIQNSCSLQLICCSTLYLHSWTFEDRWAKRLLSASAPTSTPRSSSEGRLAKSLLPRSD